MGTSINALAQSQDGYLWCGTRSGLFRFDGVKFTRFSARNTPAFFENDVIALVADDEGGLWIGTGVGGLVYYRQGVFRRFSTQDGLPDDHILSLARDRDGTLWVGTGNGVATYDGHRFTRVLASAVRGHVTSLAGDRDGNMWINDMGQIVQAPGRRHSLAAESLRCRSGHLRGQRRWHLGHRRGTPPTAYRIMNPDG